MLNIDMEIHTNSNCHVLLDFAKALSSTNIHLCSWYTGGYNKFNSFYLVFRVIAGLNTNILHFAYW